MEKINQIDFIQNSGSSFANFIPLVLSVSLVGSEFICMAVATREQSKSILFAHALQLSYRRYWFWLLALVLFSGAIPEEYAPFCPGSPCNVNVISTFSCDTH